jgi:hypothetical protein
MNEGRPSRIRYLVYSQTHHSGRRRFYVISGPLKTALNSSTVLDYTKSYNETLTVNQGRTFRIRHLVHSQKPRLRVTSCPADQFDANCRERFSRAPCGSFESHFSLLSCFPVTHKPKTTNTTCKNLTFPPGLWEPVKSLVENRGLPKVCRPTSQNGFPFCAESRSFRGHRKRRVLLRASSSSHIGNRSRLMRCFCTCLN